MTIHPTAIVDSNAELGSDVNVGPYTVISGDVKIGSGTTIGSHSTIDSYSDIGPNCEIYPHVSIGAPPQAIRYKGEKTITKIGQGSIIREFATIHRGTAFGEGLTEVGEENFLMAYTHIAHDCRTGKRVIMANNATLAGHITIGDYVTIGGLTAIHQFVRIGDYAYVGGKSALVKDIIPFVIAAGDRAKLHGINKVGLRRMGFSEETIMAIKKAYRILFRLGLTINEAMERLAAQGPLDPMVELMLSFIKSTERGITR